MVILTLNELKLIAKIRYIKGYETMSKRRLLRVLNEFEYNFNRARIKKIREKLKKLKDRFSKPKMKEITTKLFEIEKNENPSRLEKKEIEQSPTKLEEDLFRLSKKNQIVIKSFLLFFFTGHKNEWK